MTHAFLHLLFLRNIGIKITKQISLAYEVFEAIPASSKKNTAWADLQQL